jgi:hypothetical protein
MSFWVYLEDESGETVKVPKHEQGGTYVMGGTEGAELNITYNYAPHYFKHLDKDEGLRWLHGRGGPEVIVRLTRALEKLGAERDRDYWKGTEGNAGFALAILAGWAIANPHAKFRVS